MDQGANGYFSGGTGHWITYILMYCQIYYLLQGILEMNAEIRALVNKFKSGTV